MTSHKLGSTARLPADETGIARAADLLASGQLVAFPTETVYGLGADARRGEAVAAIFEAKGRPRFNPLIVHVSDLEAADALGHVTGDAQVLAEAFWPGPLTLVVAARANGGLSDLVTAGLPTVGLRMPASPLARQLLAAFGGPVAAPSANPSGEVSPTMADHVLQGLGGRIAAVLDGGPCAVGLESTIVGFGGGRARLLRPGGLAAEEIEACLGRSLAPAGAEIEAPGMMASHYAPSARLRLNAAAPRPGEAWLGFGGIPAEATGPALDLSPGRDLTEAAASLFAHLRSLDSELGSDGRIAVAAIPRTGLGLAINDRMQRAAAPRPAETDIDAALPPRWDLAHD